MTDRPPRSLTRPQADAIMALRRGGALTRAELQAQLALSRSITAALIKDLVARRIVVEREMGESQGGRPAQRFALDGAFAFLAGVDLGATSVDVALADFEGRILARHREAATVRDGPEPLLGRISALLAEMVTHEGGAPEQLLSIGLGVPGPVRFAEGVLVAPPLMPTWEDFSIRDFVRERFPRASVVVDNDVNVMALGEAIRGAGQGVENFLFVKIGTGIGCGIVCQGQIYRGRDGAAGDVGHICVDYNGPLCHCGSVGCLEALAGGPAITARAREAAVTGQSDFLRRRLDESPDSFSAADVGDAARAGDPVANEIVRSTGQMIGGMLAAQVNFFNPEMIFIGGGISRLGNRLLAAIRQAVLRRSTALATHHLRVEFSSLGDEAGVVGALWLASEHLFEIAA